MNPEKLSLLSDKELALLADRMGIFIPEGLDRLFVIEEIIDVLEEEDRERVFSHDGTGHVEEKKLSSPSFSSFSSLDIPQLPDRYSDTMIRALPRDPSWIYSYWDIADQKRERLMEFEESPLFLRVLELKPHGEHRKDFFDIPVTLDDWKWYINVPQPGSGYRVDLCYRAGEKLHVLARSNPVRMPVYFIRKAVHAPPTSSLLILSGVEALHLTEPRERHPNRLMASDEE